MERRLREQGATVLLFLSSSLLTVYIFAKGSLTRSVFTISDWLSFSVFPTG